MLCIAQRAAAWSYHSFAYGYSISVPDDWVEVPEEVLAVRLTDFPALKNPQGRLDVAFQPKRAGAASLDYPYILVEVLPYSQIGFPQQVNDREIQQIVKSNTGLDPSQPFTPDQQVMEGGGEAEGLDGVLQFDETNRRFSWSTTGTYGEIGLVRSRQWGFFGKDCLVQVTLFEKGKGSDRLSDMARAVAGSFKYEIGKEYQPAFGFSDVLKMAGHMTDTPNISLVVTGVCMLTGVVFAIIAIASNRRKAVVEQQYNIFDRGR